MDSSRQFPLAPRCFVQHEDAALQICKAARLKARHYAGKSPRIIPCNLLMQNSRNIARLVASLLINAALAVVSASSTLAAVEQWGTYEIVLEGPRSGNPYLSTRLSARFTRAGEMVSVPGFYEGNGIYKVRFMPPSAGEWRYETASDVPELNGRVGTCTATKPSGNNHGPVRVFKTFYLRYADGTAYHEFGTTCYAWVHQPRELQEQTLRTLASSPFNKIRFCVFPKSYSYNKNEPERFAFRAAGGRPV